MIRKVMEIDELTGEIVKESQYTVESELMFASRKDHFLKLYTIGVKYKTRGFVGYFHHLLRYLEPNTNRLVYRKRGVEKWITHVPLTPDDVMKELGLTRSSYYRFIGESESMGAVKYATFRNNGYSFFINPAYAINGKGVAPELYLIFEGDKVLEGLLKPNDKMLIRKYIGDTNDDTTH